ncbi:MAG: sigma-70 family RNA polymerase sigma factor [Anaerolineales bacterium]|nr:sigma-70 family RNA polymerase sigma factor [Anaerolineales bacterium]
MDHNEANLIRLAQTGDREAFGLLVEEHQRYVYNLALRVVGSQQDAEDLAQEAFVRAWLAIPNFRAEARFRTWIFRIVTNLCYNRLPSLRRELSELGEDILVDVPDDRAPNLDGLAGLEAHERRALLQREIDALPESYRLLVVLRYQQDLAYDEIARVVSLPLGTVKTGLFRAKQRLRQALLEHDSQEVLAWTA